MNDKNKVISQYPDPFFFLEIKHKNPPKNPEKGSTYTSFGKTRYVKDEKKIKENFIEKSNKTEQIKKEKETLISSFMKIIENPITEEAQNILLSKMEESSNCFLSLIEEFRKEQATEKYLDFIKQEEDKLLLLDKELDCMLSELKLFFKEEN